MAFPHRREGMLAGSINEGAMVIGTSGDILLTFVAIKTPPTKSKHQERPIPSPPTGFNLVVVEKSKPTETGGIFSEVCLFT